MDDGNNDYGTLVAADAVRLQRLLPGPIERVWRYLTDAELRGTWFASGTMEPHAGGHFEQVFRNSELTGHDGEPPAKYANHGKEMRMEGRVLAFEPPHRLVFTMGDSESPSEVEFELSTRADKVLLVVTHRNMVRPEGLLSVSGGWHAHLAILIARLEGREPEGFWPLHTRLEAEYVKRFCTDKPEQ